MSKQSDEQITQILEAENESLKKEMKDMMKKVKTIKSQLRNNNTLLKVLIQRKARNEVVEQKKSKIQE